MDLKIIVLRLLIAVVVSQVIAYLCFYFFDENFFTSLFVASILVVFVSTFNKNKMKVFN